MKCRIGLRRTLSLLVGTLMVFAISVSAAKAAPRNYGCYIVTAPKSLHIRMKAFSKSPILGTARHGDLLVKWKWLCSLRGYWCPVQKGRIRGHASKQYLRKVACP